MSRKIKTAESVTIGHPDKLADLIADRILDECLKRDRKSRVAVEVLLSGRNVIIAGEVTTRGRINFKRCALEVIAAAGYETDRLHVQVHVHKQSPDIAQAVSYGIDQGAGDQGIMYGYATNETRFGLPAPVVFARGLTMRLTECYLNGEIEGLKPDGKAQVSIAYEAGKRPEITSIIISAQHTEDTDLDKFRNEILEKVVHNGIYRRYDISKAEILINPSGKFVLGGFEADTGLTGRKLMVDTYGGLAHHGGGAFSGKDASKVDRSGAYMARYIAKNIVAAGLADECEVALTYAIGKAEPTSVDIDTFGTGDAERIKAAVLEVFDLRPAAIINQLHLRAPKYLEAALNLHFGDDEFEWEKTNRVDALLTAMECPLI